MSGGSVTLYRCDHPGCGRRLVAAQLGATLLPDDAGYRIELQPVAPSHVCAGFTPSGFQVDRTVLDAVGGVEAWTMSKSCAQHACPAHQLAAAVGGRGGR